MASHDWFMSSLLARLFVPNKRPPCRLADGVLNKAPYPTRSYPMSMVRLLYADQDGNILDHPGLGLAGSAGGRWETVDEAQCIPLPPGSDLFLLPGRRPVGMNPEGGFEVVSADPGGGDGPVSAVAAFLAPAHTATLWAAYERQPDAPNLPLFAYAAVGFARGRMVTTALRVDPLPPPGPGTLSPRPSVCTPRPSACSGASRTTGSCSTWGTAPWAMAARQPRTSCWAAGKRPCPPRRPATPPAWAASPASPRASSR